MSKHTPTPWNHETELNSGSRFSNSEFFQRIYSEDPGSDRDFTVGFTGDADKEQRIANAAYIVKACNAFPALVGALEMMEIGACAVGVPHVGERAVLKEALDHARKILHSLKSEG